MTEKKNPPYSNYFHASLGHIYNYEKKRIHTHTYVYIQIYNHMAYIDIHIYIAYLHST